MAEHVIEHTCPPTTAATFALLLHYALTDARSLRLGRGHHG